MHKDLFKFLDCVQREVAQSVKMILELAMSEKFSKYYNAEDVSTLFRATEWLSSTSLLVDERMSIAMQSLQESKAKTATLEKEFAEFKDSMLNQADQSNAELTKLRHEAGLESARMQQLLNEEKSKHLEMKTEADLVQQKFLEYGMPAGSALERVTRVLAELESLKTKAVENCTIPAPTAKASDAVKPSNSTAITIRQDKRSIDPDLSVIIKGLREEVNNTSRAPECPARLSSKVSRLSS